MYGGLASFWERAIMKVKEIMSVSPETCTPDTTLAAAMFIALGTRNTRRCSSEGRRGGDEKRVDVWPG
jgi:CBS domain-containing protein